MAVRGNNGDIPSSLESLASAVFLKEVVYKATPVKVEAVREIIDQTLIGIVKKRTRESWAESFYQLCENYLSGEEAEPIHGQIGIPNIFLVLEMILDEHFHGLRVCVPLPAFESLSALMSIITQHCLNLQALIVEIQYKTPAKRENSQAEQQPRATTTPLGSRLPNLKTLTVDFLGPSWFNPKRSVECGQSLLSIVGKYCSALRKLEFTGFCFEKMDFLALIVNGDVADVLFSRDDHRWSQDAVLSGLRIPQELLNPLCNTLEQLILRKSHHLESGRVPEFYAFALRHLYTLEVANLEVSNLEVVKLLFKANHNLYSIRANHEAAEKACLEAASEIGLYITSPSYVIDSLSLKKVELVPPNDLRSHQAVALLCPHLEELSFTRNSPPFNRSNGAVRRVTNFQSWSKKIANLKFNSGMKDPEFFEAAIQFFGPNLRKLFICQNAELVDMAFLASVCINLADLSIYQCMIRGSEGSIVSCWTPQTFFPLLTHFQSTDSCLGVWAPLIERISTLVSLTLHCCHVGTNAHNPRLEWSEIPKLWPNLENLELGKCSGLTMTMVAQLIPQLRRLRRIRLPFSLLSKDLELTEKMVNDFAMREDSVVIDYYPPRSRFVREIPCPFQFT